jgi:hypothetical protein
MSLQSHGFLLPLKGCCEMEITSVFRKTSKKAKEGIKIAVASRIDSQLEDECQAANPLSHRDSLKRSSLLVGLVRYKIPYECCDCC